MNSDDVAPESEDGDLDSWVLFTNNEFDVGTDDFADLTIESAGENFHYFFDQANRQLIKHFVIHQGKRVETLCTVTLIRKDDGYSPRFRVWKRKRSTTKSPVEESSSEVKVKAAVDLGDGHENFWKLIEFVRTFRDIVVPSHEVRIATAEDLDIAEALQGHNKVEILAAVRARLGDELSEADVQMLLDRRKTLEIFEQLLNDQDFVESERTRLGKPGPEGVWQAFFEENPWIFGYGLNLVSCDEFTEEGLEARTTGNNVFTGAGKRVDAVMRTRGFVQSLLFAEIKHAETELLTSKPYRPPDVYRVSTELSGAVSQVQKTVHKAIRKLEDLHRQHNAGGEFEFEVSTIKPKQVVVIGNLNQLIVDGNVNVEKMTSFELYRRNQQEVEILTFDELYQRARFITELVDQ